MAEHTNNRSRRGFASMDTEKRREIASKGGKAAHEKGTAHEFDSQEARSAGQKGGTIASRDREHMAEIGRKGGLSWGRRRKNAPKQHHIDTDTETSSDDDHAGRRKGDRAEG